MGIKKEFLSSGRLDNLATSIPVTHALINITQDLTKDSAINVIALFDNEEVGSQSYQGASSNFFANALKRIFNTIQTTDHLEADAFESCCSRSFVVSADMAHAYNPNYSEKYQQQHLLLSQGGIAIKINPQSKYTTDSEGGAIIKEIAKIAGVPMQEFIVRQDSSCGSTIGPVISNKLGIKTCDIGAPMLAMHSIREMMGIMDLYNYRLLFEEFFRSYELCIGELINQ